MRGTIYDVPNRWKPQRVRCLIVGENPGEQDSMYFYDVPAITTRYGYEQTLTVTVCVPPRIAGRNSRSDTA